MRTSIQHWKKLMRSFGLAENQEVYNYIIKKHSESHRAYHNLTHISDCLTRLDAEELAAADRNNLELAFWFHDVIYDSLGKENELKSALKAKELMSGQLDEVALDIVYELILITKHNELPRNDKEALIMDIDVSILGRSEAEYLAYTKAIRKEYKLIPMFLYKRKRKEILQSFLRRETLYFTDKYRKEFEGKARENISREIELLGK